MTMKNAREDIPKSVRNEGSGKMHDETRRKLLDAAAEIFAGTGFQAATVRDICARAGANVAAVNYHFGDKLGLYTELLKSSVEENQGPVLKSVMDAQDAEDALRRFLHGMFQLNTQGGRPSVYVRVMTHELAQPSPALALVVEHVIRPRSEVLHGIVGRIIGCRPDSPQTRLCVHSIVGQIVHYIHARPVIELLWPEFRMTPKRIEEIADHVTEFSLGALKAIKKKIEKRAAARAACKAVPKAISKAASKATSTRRSK